MNKPLESQVQGPRRIRLYLAIKHSYDRPPVFLECEGVKDILCTLLCAKVIRPVYFDYYFTVKEGEVSNMVYPDEKVLGPVALAEFLDFLLHHPLRRRHIGVEVEPVLEEIHGYFRSLGGDNQG